MSTKKFLIQLLFIFLFLAGIILLTNLWLRFYTNHGQKIELPDYQDSTLDVAIEDAMDKSFNIIVDDSIHIVGRPGGIIIDQNPKPKSMVKENRKIYVNVTKHNPDKIKLGDLPKLYGNDYDQKRKELRYQEINTVVDNFKYDPGEPNHILEVRYNNKVIVSRNIELSDTEIEKGGTLHFVLSQQSGGTTKIPEITCMTVKRAKFLLESTKLQMGTITKIGDVIDLGCASRLLT